MQLALQPGFHPPRAVRSPPPKDACNSSPACSKLPSFLSSLMIISTFFLSFSSSEPFRIPLPALLYSWPLFSLIVITGIYVDTYIFLNVIVSLHTTLLVCTHVIGIVLSESEKGMISGEKPLPCNAESFLHNRKGQRSLHW